jgi:hypothetical protein
LKTELPAPHMELTGMVHVTASEASLIGALWHKAASLVVREAGM